MILGQAPRAIVCTSAILYLFAAVVSVQSTCHKGGGEMEEGQTWINGELLFKCQSSTPTLVNCISQANTTEFIRIGMTYEDGFMRKKCTTRGVHVVGCVHEGKYVDKNHLVHECSGHTSKTTGCEFQGQFRHFGEPIDVPGGRRLCTENGLTAAACENKDTGEQLELGQTTTNARGVKFDCTNSGLQPSGCTTSSGDIAIGQEYIDPATKLSWQCSQGNGLVLKGCYNKGKFYSVGEKTKDSAATAEYHNDLSSVINHRCTDDGVKVEFCIYDGKNIKDGETTVISGLTVKCDGERGAVALQCVANNAVGTVDYGKTAVDTQNVNWKCTKKGLIKVGCIDDTNQPREFGDVYAYGDRVVKCTDKGLQSFGCPRDGKYIQVGESITINNFMYRCTESGKLENQGCPYTDTHIGGKIKDEITIPVGESHQDGEFTVRCDAHSGIVNVGCNHNGKHYEIDEMVDDHNLRYKCTSHGLEKQGCIYKDTVITSQHSKNINGLVVVCNKDGSTTANSCETNNCCGSASSSNCETVPLNGKAEINGVWKKCVSGYGWKEITCETSASQVSLKYKGTVVVNGVRHKCTKEGTLKPKACVMNGQEVSIGQLLEDAGTKKVWYCKETGFERLGCRKEDGQIAKVNAKEYTENGLVRTCEDHGLRTQACILENGSRLPVGDVTVINGLQKICNENGVENKGCPQGSGKPNVPVQKGGTIFEIADMRYKCTKHGAIPIDCKWTSGEWKAIGQDVDQLGVKRHCTKDGWKSVGCPEESGAVVNIGSEFDTADFRKLCTATHADVKGCYYQTTTFVEVDKSENHKGLDVKCTSDGIQRVGCPSADGMQPVAHEYRENGLVKKCTDQGVVILGCPSSKGPQKVGRRFEDKGVAYNCTENGAVPFGCNWKDGKVRVGESFVVNGVTRECTNKGLEIKGCVDGKGKLAKLNAAFTINGLKQNCTEGGAYTGGCIMDDGSVLPVTQKGLNAHGLKVLCDADGLEVLGCPTEDETIAAIGTEYMQKKVVKVKCTDNGAVPQGCVTHEGQLIGMQKIYVMSNHLELRCTEKGWEKLGCDRDNGPVVPIGQSFQDEKLAYACTDDGTVVEGCVNNGVIRKPHEVFVEMDVKKRCDPHHGVEELACIYGSEHHEVTMDKKIEQIDGSEKSSCQLCTSFGLVFNGCIMHGEHRNWTFKDGSSPHNLCVREDAIPDGKKLYEDSLLKVCTPEGLIILKCLYDRETHDVGEVYDGKPSSTKPHSFRLRYKCTSRGIEELGCVFDDGVFITTGSVRDYNGVLMQCKEHEGLVPNGCTFQGNEYRIGEQSDDSEFRYKCTDHGFKKQGCLHKGTFFELGKSHQEGSLTVFCDEQSGPRPSGCIYKQSSYKIGSDIDDGKFRYTCTGNGVARYGCLYKNTVITTGSVYDDNGLQVKCHESGTEAKQCKTTEQTTDAGEVFVSVGDRYKVHGTVWKKCVDGYGWKEITCGNPVSQGQQMKVKETVVVDGKLRKKCTKDATLKPVACLRNGQDERRVGEHLDDQNRLVWECTKSGFDRSGCRKKDGSIAPIGSEQYNEDKLTIVCNNDGPVTISCFLDSGSQLKKGDTIVINGLEKKCLEDGIHNLGCPSGAKSAQVMNAVGSSYEDNNIRYKCTDQGAIPTDCKWIDGTWNPVGSERDYLGVQRRCMTDGSWKSQGCVDENGKLAELGSTFDKNDFKKLCTDSAAVVKGCYYLSQKSNLEKVDEDFNFNGFVARCTADGVLPKGCPASGKADLVTPNVVYEEKGLMKLCEATGVTILGCPSSKGPQKIGIVFQDKGMTYRCTDNGAVPLTCKWQSGEKKVGETWVVDGLQRKCTEKGIEIEGCPGDSGIAKLNKMFTVHGLHQNCTEGGARTGGCYMDDGTLLPLGQKKVNRKGLEVECEQSGLRTLGCPTAQGQTVAIDAHFMDEKGVVLRSCTTDGPVPIGCLTAEQDFTPIHETGITGENEDVKLMCTDSGWNLLGCILDDGEEQQVVPVGTDFQDDEWAYKCYETGIRKVGCVSRDAIRQPGEIFEEASVKKQCDMEHGIENLGCIIEATEVPMDGTYELENGKDHSLCQKCTTTGILINGCILHAGRQWKPMEEAKEEHLVCKAQDRIDVGSRIYEDNLLKICTSEGLSVLNCIVNGKHEKIGYTFTDSDGVTKVCDTTGIIQHSGRRRFKIAITDPKKN